MAGSWEISEANQVLVGILHTETTSVAWSFGLRNLIIPGDPNLRRFDPFMVVAGRPFDMARNDICMAALQVGAKNVFMYDSDVIPPRDAILRLMRHNLPIVSGMYCRRSPPESVPVMIKNGGWFIPQRLGAMYEVDLVGAGCLLLKTDMLRKLPAQRPGYHWFDWKVNMKGIVPDGEALSEDFTFNVHARKHGYKTYVDTSIRCRHAGMAESDLGTFKALNTATMT